jgi:ferric-dicitrate binding protein FerR (iron transport regulator)
MTDDAPRPSGPPDSVPDWDTLGRFVAGESSADEMSQVGKWLDANPAERALLERLTEVTAAAPVAGIDVEAALASVHARMGERTPAALSPASARAKLRWQPLAFASLLAAAAVVALFVRRQTGSPAGSVTTVASQTFSTTVGKRDSITLSDGSRVVLGPDSRLTVPPGFGSGSRAVELHGDAYFDVRHDAASPFAVRVGSALIQDVGTTFMVESDDANATVVTVVTGSVRLRAADSPSGTGVLLAAGERGSIDDAGRTSTERASYPDDDVAWTTGKLVFRDAQLSRVAAEVHRWYGVHLHVSDPSMLSQHVTTTVYTNQPVDQVLHVIELSLGVKIERQGDSAVVVAGRSTTPPTR